MALDGQGEEVGNEVEREQGPKCEGIIDIRRLHFPSRVER